jgi:hypothetical protein
MRKRVPVVLGAGLVAAAIALVAAARLADSRADGPEQPIPFSHALHAGTYEIACLYCHQQADRSTVAGIPSVRTCLDCHRGLEGAAATQPQLIAAWEGQETIAWRKVYDLPDHVYFSHKRHVRVGVSCQACHGPVQEMERVRRVRDLTMGWCLACHREARLGMTREGAAHAVLPGSNPHQEIDFIDTGEGRRSPSIDCATCHK